MKKSPAKKRAPKFKFHSLHWSGCSDIGRVRKNNEDAFLGLQFDAQEVFRLGKFGRATTEKTDFAFAVCDGMGGAKSGEFASNIAVEKITLLLRHSFRQKDGSLKNHSSAVLKELFTQIHRALVYLGGSYDECEGMQTTMSLGWFIPGWLAFGHIGDSRIYHLPAGGTEIKQLTEDDTHVGWLFRTGQINEREARNHPRRNVLQKALGGTNQFVHPQTGLVPCKTGDTFLICSDGLVDGLYNHHLTGLLRADNSDHCARTLVNEAVKNSGRDNTTALVVRVT
jgi:protein phosphatase